MKKITRPSYVWVGQKASTGTPNTITGLMSLYGEVLKFKTKKEAVAYADNFYNQNNPREFAVQGGRAKMREYCLGQSMYGFNEMLDSYLNYRYYDEETGELE